MRGLPSGVEVLPAGPVEKVEIRGAWQRLDREASVKKRQKRRKAKRPTRRTPAPQGPPDEEMTPKEWEAETPGETAAIEREWEGLPNTDEETKVVLLPVNPYLVHVYWGIASRDLDQLRGIFKRGGPPAQPVLRFYDITKGNFDAKAASSGFDVEIDLGARNWYVHLESPAKTYGVDLGLRTAEDGFHRLARSNVAETPRAWPSDKVDESYLLVESDYSQVEKVGAPIERGKAVKTPPETIQGGIRPNPEENMVRATEAGSSRLVEAPGPSAEITAVSKSPAGALNGGRQQEGEEERSEEKGQEAKELRLFRTVAPGEIERIVAELYRPQEWDRSSLMAQASNAGEPQLSGKKPADLTALSEKSFRTGISSAQR